MMWDLSGGRATPQPPPQSAPPRMPSPAFPVPQHAPSSSHSNMPNVGSLYPPLPLYGSTSAPVQTSRTESFDAYQTSQDAHYPTTSQYTTPSGHTITVTHHSKSSHRRQRRHSHSVVTPIPTPTPPQAVPQVPIYTTYAPVSYTKPTIIYPPNFGQSSQQARPPSQPRPSSSQEARPSKPSRESSSQKPTKMAKPSKSSDSNTEPEFRYYSKCTGRRKALCIGINYRGQSNELRGCVNDAKNMRRFLIDKGGYRSEDIVLLTDDVSNPRQLPTRKNIISCMKWLVRNANPNDALFFHYSGHGGQTRDLDGDEIDGWDEVIYPLDFKKNGHITDDEMHDLMVKPLPERCRLTALFDSCHSGTVLDLPYIYSSRGRLKGSHVSDRARRRKKTYADVVSLVSFFSWLKGPLCRVLDLDLLVGMQGRSNER
ncbi:hypothetical protein CC2G_001636 [Coprinopsis cinerea AmutBmut pab1-1]|nr:hypothetical protein CC2G_001636 [Coprinopsis cinerea AmutBmut pab1-1]